MSTQNATTYATYVTTTTGETKKELCGFVAQFPLLRAKSLFPLLFYPLGRGRVERKEVKKKAKEERGFDKSSLSVFVVFARGLRKEFLTTLSCAR